MTDDTDPHYDDDYTGLLEAIWGEGYLSPGGPEEVARVLEGLDLSGKTVLDIGCGSGAVTLSLARDHGATTVIGIDVEDTVCETARARMADAGFGESVEIRKVDPGPFEFADQSFDIVFSKDSIIHIPDKEFLAAEAFRVLKPGGWFAASDWLISHDDTPSPEMKAYLELEDIGLEMASPRRYHAAMKAAGFVDIETVNRNPWYRQVARDELALLEGPQRADLIAQHGSSLVEYFTETWHAMVGVLDTGEHCPHHLRGRRP